MPRRFCQRVCPLPWAALVLESGRDMCEWAQLRGAWVAGGRAGYKAGSAGNVLHTPAYGGVDLDLSYTGLVGRGRGGASLAPYTNIVTSPTSRSSSGGCQSLSAASSFDPSRRYVARARFRYGDAYIEGRVLRVWSRAGALVWREVPDPSTVSCSLFPIDRGRPDWLDMHHSMRYP